MYRLEFIDLVEIIALFLGLVSSAVGVGVASVPSAFLFTRTKTCDETRFKFPALSLNDPDLKLTVTSPDPGKSPIMEYR